MPLTISAADVTGLATSLRIVLSPIDHPRLDGWRAAVNESLRSLLRADKATFMLPASDAALMFSEDVSPRALQAYASYYRTLDIGLLKRRKELGLRVWNRGMLWNPGELRRSEYYCDFARPNRLHDALGITLELDGTPELLAGLSFHHERPRGSRFGERGLTLLRLVLPAFDAGVRTRLRLSRHGSSFAQVFDNLAEGLVLWDMSGRVREANRAALSIFEEDSERERLHREMELIAHSLRMLARSSSERHEPALPAQPVSREVHTARGRYRIRGSYLDVDLFSQLPAVLVALERLTPTPPSRAMLRQRFGLTEREADVALLLSEGLSNAEIADRLSISPHTARHHSESVLLKLGVDSRAQVGPVLMRR
jgi:DNA-binding CsgD family transcriptional regulator